MSDDTPISKDQEQWLEELYELARVRRTDREGDRYELTLTEGQAQVISDALELFLRIHMGQLDSVVDVLEWQRRDFETLHELRDELRKLSPLATGIPCRSSYHGIHSKKIHDRSRVAYDLHQVVRHALAYARNPEPEITNIHKDAPRRSSQTEALASIRKVNVNE